MTSSFSIGLFEVGDVKSCLYSFLCTPCAMAESVKRATIRYICYFFLKHSGYTIYREISLMVLVSVLIFSVYRLFHTGELVINSFSSLSLLISLHFRWMVRTAYDIGNPSDCVMDCLLSTFCTCCVVNQLYQTTSIKGNPTTDGGAHFNTQKFTPTPCNFVGCLYASFCLPCSLGTILQDSVGMPFFLGCCCFNLFNARNVVRYQYRINHHINSTSDCSEECLIPWGVYILANCTLSFFCPCLQICLFPVLCGAVVAIDMELLNESSTRKGGQNQAYLRGYSLPQSNVPPVLVSIAPGAVEMSPYMARPVEYNLAPGTYAQQQQPVYVTIATTETTEKH